MSKAERDEALVKAIEQAEEESYGADNISMDGELSSQRAQAIDAYLGRNTNPAPEGNTQIVSRDLFDTIEWITPSLVRIFAGSDEVVKFNPVGPEDEKQAKQETLYVNHIVTKRNPWTQIFHDWVKDALLTKNAYCLAYRDNIKRVEYELYEDQSDDAFALLMQDQDDFEVLEHSQEVDEDELKKQQQWFQQATAQYQQMAQQAMLQAVQSGQQPQIPPPPEMPPTPMLHSVKIRRTEEEKKVCLKVLPPEKCVIHHSTPSYMLNECDFFEYWDDVTISSLRQMGFDVPDDIRDDTRSSFETVEEFSRNLYNEQRRDGEEIDPSMRKVKVRMCWIRQDYDGDGIAELQYVIIVGTEILYREECSRIPVASIVATPIPHRHIGISIADVMLEVQEAKQAMLRQGIDNLFHANNPRLFAVDGKINIDDALVSRPGGVVRGMQGTDAVFGRDIAPIVIPNIFPQAVQGMEYMDRISERRTGVNGVFTGNVSPEVLTQTTGMAMNQMGTAAAQKVEQIARMIAPSVEYLFQVVHELILKGGHKEEVVRLQNEWVTVDPSQWKKRSDLTIAVGLGSGNKDTVLSHLNMMFQQQMALLPMGITDPSLIYNTVSEIAKMAGFASPEPFWKLPPQNPPPPSPPPEIVKEQMKLQADAQKFQAETQVDMQKYQADQQAEKMKLAFEASEREKDRQLELEKAKMQEATKLAIAQMQVENQEKQLEKSQQFEGQKIMAQQSHEARLNGTEDVEKENSDMSELMQNLITALGTLNDAIRRPRVPERDPKTGKPLYGRLATDEEMARMMGTMQ
jgi:AraC-like DNA-binding protein